MIKVHLPLCGLLIGLVATAAYSEVVPGVLEATPSNCAMLGLAFHNSAAITLENVKTMRTRGQSASTSPASLDAFLAPMEAQSQKLTDTANALERRYGKAKAASQVAQAEALSQKPLKPMKDLAANCLK